MIIPGKKNIPYYLLSLAVFALLRSAYSSFDTYDLSFLLKPTTGIISWVIGFDAVYVAGEGYFYEQLNVIINESCSGYHFGLLCFVMLVFLSVKHFGSNIQKILALVLSFLCAYIITILANSSRIISSIVLQKKVFPSAENLEGIVHESIGIVTNLVFLIVSYFIIEKALIRRKAHAKFT